jgi:hypothetical protein
MINNVKKVRTFKNWRTEQVVWRTPISAWLVSVQQTFMRREGIRTPRRPNCRGFAPNPRIFMKGLKKLLAYQVRA